MKQDTATFTPRNVVKLFIVYELVTWSRDFNTKFTLGDCLFGAVTLTKNADPDKSGYTDYVIGFDLCSSFSINGEWVNMVFLVWIIVLSVYADNRKKKQYPSS